MLSGASEPRRHLVTDHRWSGGTQAFCVDCDLLAPADYELGLGTVVLVRKCPRCGPTCTEISTDQAYWDRCQRVTLAPNQPLGARPPILGCPLDCGICTAHATPISAVIAEIIDGCNMTCPTCIAASLPGLHGARTAADLRAALDEAV